jgi:hypothetical protein
LFQVPNPDPEQDRKVEGKEEKNRNGQRHKEEITPELYSASNVLMILVLPILERVG